MAATHLKASILDRLGDTIKCHLCGRVFNDPRILPCFHTFCFQCLQLSPEKKDKTKQDRHHCSTCQREFNIEASDGFPKNLFIDKLLDLVNIEQTIVKKESYCELCFDDQAGSLKSPLASFYCVECRQKICIDCCKRHKKSNFLKDHSCVDFEMWKIWMSSAKCFLLVFVQFTKVRRSNAFAKIVLWRSVWNATMRNILSTNGKL